MLRSRSETERLLYYYLGGFYRTMLSEEPWRAGAWPALPAATVRELVRLAQGMPGHFVTNLRRLLDDETRPDPLAPERGPTLPSEPVGAERGPAAPNEPAGPAATGVAVPDAGGERRDPAALARWLRHRPALRRAVLEGLPPDYRAEVLAALARAAGEPRAGRGRGPTG